VLSVGANAAFAQGTLEICKSSLNGASGITFEFTIAGVGSPVSVRGGRCSGPMTVPHGSITITETGFSSGSWQVADTVVRPSQRDLGLSGNTATVNVPAGTTAANETRITFINEPGGGLTGDLKVCKLTETPAFYGRQFSFTVNGGPAVSTEANPAFDDPSTWSCRLLGSFQQGSVVRVQELIPANTEIAFIDSDPADCLQDFDTNAGYADALIGPGACVLLFDNEAVAPTGTGFIEVCKDAGFNNSDGQVLGVPFDFTITEADGSQQDVTVLGGQCTAPIVVAAGVVRVEEHDNPGYTLVDVYTIPEDRLLAENLINGTADVEVPTSDNPNDETQVHFVNERDRSQLKICKALGPNSLALIGAPNEPFEFSVTNAATGYVYSDRAFITAAGSTQCVIYGDLPTGLEVTITELNPRPYSTVSCSPNGGTITIGPGINTVTCTNSALGKIEVCKFSREDLTGANANRLFYFSISGGGTTRTVSTRAFRCTQPVLVTPGNYTVTETSDQPGGLGGMQDYELDPGAPGNGIVVTPSTAEVSRNLLARSVTVAVPWAGAAGDEVRVDFWDRRRRGQIKICKHLSPGSEDYLGTKTFDFQISSNNTQTVTDSAGGFPTTFTLTGVAPGECRLVPDGSTGAPRNVPIILTNGTPTEIRVFEVGALNTTTGAAGFYITALSLQGGRGSFDTMCSGTPALCSSFGAPLRHADWNLGPNTNTLHVTNRAVADP
jgi:hypothetical protein